jgi:vacuolar-type H+-ATPase subunit E/Vma4
MSGMEKISETVLEKVKEEAGQIIKQANEAALKEINKAEKQAGAKYDAEKQKVFDEAEREAARILAKAQIEARQKIAQAKAEVIDQITASVEDRLNKVTDTQVSLANLIKEAVDGLNTDKAIIYVSAKDKSNAEKALKEDKALAGKVKVIKESKFNGGVIAESVDGMLRVDNTYATRLKMLLPQIMPEIEKTLFSDK